MDRRGCRQPAGDVDVVRIAARTTALTVRSATTAVRIVARVTRYSITGSAERPALVDPLRSDTETTP